MDSQPHAHSRADGLLDRMEVIEAQPLDQRAAGYDQLAEQLLTQLQSGDGEASTQS